MKSLYRIHHTASNGKQTAVTAASWVRHTYCCEPSLVLLPNFTKRLFGGAAGRLEGLGGIERSSSQETFIWFIPPLPFNCCWRFEIMTGASYGVPSIRTHYFASFPVMFFLFFFFNPWAQQEDLHFYALRNRRSCRCFQLASIWRRWWGKKGGEKPVFFKKKKKKLRRPISALFHTDEEHVIDWCPSQKADSSERCLYLRRCSVAARWSCRRLCQIGLFQMCLDSAKVWCQECAPAHSFWDFQNKTSRQKDVAVCFFVCLLLFCFNFKMNCSGVIFSALR